MNKKMAKLGFYWLGCAALAPLLATACSGTAMSLGDTAGAGGKASSNAGSSADSAGTSASGGKAAAGGNAGGAAGSSTGGAAAGSAQTGGTSASGGAEAAGGPSMGGASSGPCAGQTCSADQICCGPAECGHCISKLSGAACPAVCPGGGGGTGGAPDCAQLLADVNKTQAAAQACNPASAKPIPECMGTLDGVCCPIGVESASETAPANVAYLDALKAYNASCAHACPEIACFQPKVGDCKPVSASSGKCGP